MKQNKSKSVIRVICRRCCAGENVVEYITGRVDSREGPEGAMMAPQIFDWLPGWLPQFKRACSAYDVLV